MTNSSRPLCNTFSCTLRNVRVCSASRAAETSCNCRRLATVCHLQKGSFILTLHTRTREVENVHSCAYKFSYYDHGCKSVQPYLPKHWHWACCWPLHCADSPSDACVSARRGAYVRNSETQQQQIYLTCCQSWKWTGLRSDDCSTKCARLDRVGGVNIRRFWKCTHVVCLSATVPVLEYVHSLVCTFKRTKIYLYI